jgi:glutamate dehydrogenase (NADP+)
MLADEWKDIEYRKNEKPWTVPCDIAMPCATENEIDDRDAACLLDNGVTAVCEGANMPTAPEALERLLAAEHVIVAPGKAANAGGVAVSGMELSQNATRVSWSREKVDEKLIDIMSAIHDRCVMHGETSGTVDYVKGANIAGFQKVASAMLAHGVI